MTLLFRSDGIGIQIQVTVKWRSLRATLRKLLPLVTALLSLLMSPEIARLGSFFGWW